MGVIDDFISEYERQFDFWEASARTARGLLEAELASSGLRAIVTSRAKSVDRLVDKLHARARQAPYKSVAEISDDIADRAGVRVALYFPGQMDKHFPSKSDADGRKTGESEPDVPSGDGAQAASGAAAHRQRFSGYGARHFRVNIPESRLSAGQERYASALIEVQVASVLMHAWSEVEHDLVYKPLEGELSASEYALLDQLNGLVLAGEIALEQLQQAGDARLTAAETPFRNHYELAEFLRTRLSALGVDLTDATLGRIDVLFDYLAEQRSATASSVTPYLHRLEQDFERRPVAAQLADLMLSGNEARYKAFLSAMAASRNPTNRKRTTIASLETGSPGKLALGEFVTAWVLFENMLKDVAVFEEDRLPPLSTLLRQLRDRGLISPKQFTELEAMRELRNRVVHRGVGEVPPELLRDAAVVLRGLTKAIERKGGPS